MGNVVTYSFGFEQLHEVVRQTVARKTFEQHREEYARVLKEAGVINTRFEHNPDWRNSLLSCQNIGDEWRDMTKTLGQPIINYMAKVESDLFWLGFDFVAWRVGLTWVDEEWKEIKEQEPASSGSSSAPSSS